MEQGLYQRVKTIATYQIEYGEDISRLFAVVDYNVQLKNI